MTAPSGRLDLTRGATGVLLALALIAAGLLAIERQDYPELHTVLDAGVCLLSGVLALVFWDVGAHTGRFLSRWLAISFAAACLLQSIHVLVLLEWSGPLAGIAQAAGVLRPATWGPAAYVLPMGIGGSLWLMHRDARHTLGFAITVLLLGASLLALFSQLPRYVPPVWFGVTRPALVLVPALWMLVGWVSWRQRARNRLLPTLALMALVLALTHVSMLYSRAPNDTEAMVAHLGTAGGFLLLLLSRMRMASVDMLERIRAEQELAQLNEGLELRVQERTTQLEATNTALEAEIAVRQGAEQKVLAQLERLNLLHYITRAIGERQDLGSIFQVAIRSLEDQLGVDFCCVCLHDQPDNILVVAGVGLKSEALAITMALTDQARVDIDANGLARCVAGALVYEPDISAVPFAFPSRLARVGLRSLVAVPLLVESRVFGVLVAARIEAHAFSSGECEFLRQLAEHVALAAHQAELHGALQHAYDDLRQTQQSVVQQERLRALGQMASGIAHDINNAISPVTLYAEALLDQEPQLSVRAREYLEIIQRASADVAHTVARMREFSRQRKSQEPFAPVAVNQLVQQVVELTRARWSDIPQQRGVVIQVVTELASDLEAVVGSESEIREALTNLVFNAVDAMPEGGRLNLRTSSAVDEVHIEVADTGPGMDEVTRARCLEPFFTTKGERGTGLGLAMVYGILKRHGAEIEIDSAPGQGTTFRLRFPIPTIVAERARDAAVSVVPSHLRILVIDDDPLVLKALRDTLEGEGHVVVAANGGQAGVDAFRATLGSGEAFAVVITDLGMPYVDGRRVAAAVKAESSSTPVILLTGWGQRLIDKGDVPPHVDLVLGKPPRLRELREALASCCPPPV